MEDFLRYKKDLTAKKANIYSYITNNIQIFTENFRTAKNIWIDICRSKQRNAQVPLEEIHQDDSSYDHPLYETQELLEALFGRLLPKPLVILLFYEVFGFTAKETAKHIGATEGSVQVALSRSRSRLNQLASRGDAGLPVVGVRTNSIENAFARSCHRCFSSSQSTSDLQSLFVFVS